MISIKLINLNYLYTKEGIIINIVFITVIYQLNVKIYWEEEIGII